jgi:hypothetical protein
MLITLVVVQTQNLCGRMCQGGPKGAVVRKREEASLRIFGGARFRRQTATLIENSPP